MLTPGNIIKINHMDGEPEYEGRIGILKFIDSAGYLHGTWGGLSIIPSEDSYTVFKVCGDCSTCARYGGFSACATTCYDHYESGTCEHYVYDPRSEKDLT